MTNIGISIFAYVRESVTVRCFVDSAIYSYAQENGISTELLSRGKLESPSFQQAPTTGGVTVSISSSGGTIHYTTDGTAPTGESSVYSAPFPVRSANTTIKAVATAVGWESSDTAVLDIALEKVAPPFASHPSGSRVSAGTRVELYCQTEGAEIRFTTDGNIPTASNVYREPVEITEDTTLYVVAVRDGMLDSVLSVFSYQIAGQEEPVVSTLEAVNITDSSAMISAHLDQPDDVVYVKFVYYEKNRSQAKYTVQADANYCAVLSGLSPDTEYWYQACAVNNTGWHSGSILSFKTDIAEDAKPVSIELNPTYLLIHPGDTKTLLPTILPASASNRDVFWSSANPLVATVDTNGVVSATGLGSTTIEAVTVYGRLTASCTVEVTTTEISGVFDFSEWNMMTNSSRDDPYGFDHDVNAGGNAQMASAYLTRWDGPVTELSDPYPASAEDGAYHEIDAPYHVQNILYLPYRNDSLDNGEIKNAVMRYGAVYASLKINYDYFSDNQTNYYLPSNVRRYNGGHSIAIIGWDDNYSRTNFAVTPEGNGAFLCKNSWGTDAGENGYFYVSYYDKTLARPDSNDYNAVFCGLESMDNYNKIYQYDYLGPVLPRSLSSPSAYVCNVFPEHGSSLEENELLKAVACYNYEPGTAYEVYVISSYVNKSSLADLGTPLQTGIFEYAGYYTIQLEQALALSAGTRFAVVVRYTPPSGDTVIYAELPATISAQGRQIDHSSKARANADESYISVNARNWMDFTSVAANANVCVKAFTQTGTGGQAALQGIDNPGRHYENDTVYTFEELENLGFSVNPAFHDAFLLDGEETNTEEDFGFLPPSILPDLHTNHNYAEGCAFPESYDLRTENGVTSVKNQNPIGGCWSFAACASLESWAKKAQALSESLSEDGLNQASGQASSIALSTDGMILALGTTAQIRAELQPYDSTQSVLWFSSDSRVASVSTHGLVTALRTGNAYITASTLDGTMTAQCSVTVTSPQPLRMIAIDTPETQLSPGETLLMRYSLYPSNCASPTLEWHSSNPAVASVNQYGLLTAKSAGISEITVSSQDGKVSVPVQISVEGQAAPLCTMEMEENLLSVGDDVISGSLACRVENTEEDMDECLLIAAFYEGDRFLSFVRQTVAPRSGSNVFRFNEVRTGRTEGEEITVKVFLLSETLIPLSPPLSGHVERVDV